MHRQWWLASLPPSHPPGLDQPCLRTVRLLVKHMHPRRRPGAQRPPSRGRVASVLGHPPQPSCTGLLSRRETSVRVHGCRARYSLHAGVWCVACSALLSDAVGIGDSE